VGSSSVEHFVNGDALHVAYDASEQMWWAIGKAGYGQAIGAYGEVGSFGGDKVRRKAVDIALDASATGSNGRRHVIIHNKDGSVARTIEGTRRKGSSQLFQDNVE
jgi:hypothetical protein